MLKKSTYPQLSDLELSNRCNLNCPICTLNKRKEWNIDIHLLTNILIANKDILSWQSIWLHFRWEPLLYPNLTQVISLLDTYNIKSRFSTNWILLNDIMRKKLINSKLHTIWVSALTTDPVEYVRLRWKNVLQEVERNILSFKKELDAAHSKINLQVIGIDYWQPRKKLHEFIDKYNKLGIVVAIHKFSYRTWEVSYIPKNSIKSQVQERFPCHRPFTKIWILWNWDIAACCYDMEWKTLNINIKDYAYSLKKIWDSSVYQKMRENHLSGVFQKQCKNCSDWIYENPALDKKSNTFVTLYTPDWKKIDL